MSKSQIEDISKRFNSIIGKKVVDVKMIWKNDLDFIAKLTFEDGQTLEWGYEAQEGSTTLTNKGRKQYD